MDLGEWWDVEGEATVTWEAWEGCRRWPTPYLLTSVAWWSAKVQNDSVCFTGSSLALCEYSKKSFFVLIYFIIDLNFLSHVVCSLNPRLLIQTLLITVYPTSPDCPFFFSFFLSFYNPDAVWSSATTWNWWGEGGGKGWCVCVTTLLFSLRGSCIQHKWHSLASLRA